MYFEWDEEKAKTNFKKHKVSFDEAVTVFFDSFSITIPDPSHSVDEQRYVDVVLTRGGFPKRSPWAPTGEGCW